MVYAVLLTFELLFFRIYFVSLHPKYVKRKLFSIMRKKTDNEIVNTFVKEVREARKVSKQDIADKLGVTRQGIYKVLDTLENGGGTIQSLSLVAKALDCELWEFFVSPEEAEEIKELRKMSTTKVKCPHCGKEITIKLE